MHGLDGLLDHEDGHGGAVDGIRWILVAEPVDLDGVRLGAEKGGEVTDVPDGLADVLLRVGDLEIRPELQRADEPVPFVAVGFVSLYYQDGLLRFVRAGRRH